jgi:(2R)-ethylmalonyl-CoA mutase
MVDADAADPGLETDLLEYGDLFDGNPAVDAKVEELKEGARAELANRRDGRGDRAIDYMKGRLVEATPTACRIERGETVVVGVNKYTQSEPSPLMGEDGGIMVVDPAVEADQIARLRPGARRATRPRCGGAGRAAGGGKGGRNIMPASIAAAKAGVTTGEWAGEMRAVFGEYRGPTGVSKGGVEQDRGLDDIRAAVDAVSDRLGRRLKFLVGKPGLDGHSNGAEQIAFRARDCGMDIAYEGIRLTPRDRRRRQGGVGAHVVGLSILSGSHVPLVGEVMERMRAEGLGDIPGDGGRHHSRRGRRDGCWAMGVARVYTPKDFELNGS